MNEHDTIAAEIIKAINALPQVQQSVTQDTNIARDLGLDSLAVMNFVMTLEDQFDVSISMDKLADIKTVRDLADAIAELKRHQTGT